MSISKTTRRAKNAVRQEDIERRGTIFPQPHPPFLFPAVRSWQQRRSHIPVITPITGKWRPFRCRCVPLLAAALDRDCPRLARMAQSCRSPLHCSWSPVMAADSLCSPQCQRCSSPHAFRFFARPRATVWRALRVRCMLLLFLPLPLTRPPHLCVSRCCSVLDPSEAPSASGLPAARFTRRSRISDRQFTTAPSTQRRARRMGRTV
jgi:hypothetical protein